MTTAEFPGYVWALVLIGVIGLPAATCAALYRGAIAAGLTRRKGVTVAVMSAVVLTCWLAVAAILAGTGAYQLHTGRPVPWLAVVAAVSLIGFLAATKIPLLSHILAAPGTVRRLSLPHAVRVVGVVFVAVLAQGRLPAVFALPAGLGDFAVGIAAMFLVRRLAAGNGHAAAIRFNWLGIVDLVVAVAIAFLSLLIIDTSSVAPLQSLPLALIPAVPVPLAIALHIVSLRQLRVAKVSGKPAPAASPIAGRSQRARTRLS